MASLLFHGSQLCLCFAGSLLLLFLILYQITKIILNYIRHLQQSQADIPPGALGFPLIGETLQFIAAIKSGKGFYDFVRIRRFKFGSCFKTNLFGETHVFVSSTESAKMILNNESGNFTKRYLRSIAALVGNQSLLCANPQHHKILRSRLSNFFCLSSLSRLVKQFDMLIVENLRSWEHRSTNIVVLDEALKITCEAMCKMLMSKEWGHELEVLQKEVARVCEAMLALPIRIPGTRFYKGLQARKKIMSIIEREIRERRRGLGAYREDFLDLLLNEDDKASLSDSEIKDNILTMIIAGQDKTASAITWMVKFLDENQDILQKLRNEFKVARKTSTSESFLTLEDLNDMPYASKVVKESLRMASIVPWFPRQIFQDCEIEGFRIKRGWNVNIDARSIHLDPTVFNDPNKFNPSRFDDESRPYSFLAFGMGGRTCLGINMAKAMMLVFLHRLITTYRWKVMDTDSSIEKWAMFSKLKSGCPVTVTRITCENDGYY